MPISSLSKISVPGADGNGTSLLMPKLQYRFRVTLEGFGVSNGEVFELTKQVVDVTRPNVSFEPVEIPVYNSKAYLAGRPTWDPITLNLREDIDGRVQKLVGEQLQKQFDFMEQASAASGIDYKFTTRIEITDGGNGKNGVNVLETFVLVGCFIESANYNTLAYSSNDPVTVTLSIRYDNAVQTPTGDGIGVDVGRTLGSLITGGG
jgi:hypothetical protein